MYFPFRVPNFSADGSQVDGRNDSAWSVEAVLVILNVPSGDSKLKARRCIESRRYRVTM